MVDLKRFATGPRRLNGIPSTHEDTIYDIAHETQPRHLHSRTVDPLVRLATVAGPVRELWLRGVRTGLAWGARDSRTDTRKPGRNERCRDPADDRSLRGTDQSTRRHHAFGGWTLLWRVDRPGAAGGRPRRGCRCHRPRTHQRSQGTPGGAVEVGV